MADKSFSFYELWAATFDLKHKFANITSHGGVPVKWQVTEGQTVKKFDREQPDLSTIGLQC